MDGFEENEQILVIAATNLMGNIDPALQRPGRFDHKMEIKLPTVHDRFKIIEIHLKNKPHDLGVQELTKAAMMLENCSGADIENLVNLVALQTVRVARMQGGGQQPKITINQFFGQLQDFMREKNKIN